MTPRARPLAVKARPAARPLAIETSKGVRWLKIGGLGDKDPPYEEQPELEKLYMAAHKPKALDLFCGAGGATRGLQMAGYHVTGVDIRPQPRYCGDAFIQGDAFDWLSRDLSIFNLIWASPKCQAHSVLTPTEYKANHEVQLPKVLDILRAQPIPYIVENVEGTQKYMRNPVRLCGSMFGLDVWRHRWFEIGNIDLFFLLPSCNHSFAPVVVSGTPRRGGIRKEPCAATCRGALETPWMTRAEMDQAIPPAYSKFLAKQILQSIMRFAPTAHAEREE